MIKDELVAQLTQIENQLKNWSSTSSQFVCKEMTFENLCAELAETILIIKNEVLETASTILLHEFFATFSTLNSYAASASNDQHSYNQVVEQTHNLIKLLNQFGYKNSRLDAIIKRSLGERKAAAEAFNETNRILDEIRNIKNKANEELVEIDELHSRCFPENVESIGDKIDAIEKRLNDLLKDGGTFEEIKSLNVESSRLKDEIRTYYLKVFVGNDSEESIKSSIESVENEIKSKRQTIEAFVLRYIDGYSKKVVDSNGGEIEEIVKSKKQIIDELHISFEEFIESETKGIEAYKNQFLIYENLQKKRVEELLKIATNASLASSFETLKEKISIKRENAEKAFILGLLLIVAGVLLPYLSYIEELLFKPDQIYLNLLKRITITAPFIWFAIHQSIKISQYFRLEQEYAHKEVVSRSFEGYKAQVNELYKDRDGSHELLDKLLSSAISAISKNPTVVLDKIKAHHSPLGPLVDSLSENTVKALEQLRK